MKNLLLDLVSLSDLKLLQPHLRPAYFKQHHVLFEADEKIRHVYFPAGAVVSLIITLSTGEMVEAAMVGMDGVVGASAALDGKVSLSRRVIQLPGEIIVCDIDALKTASLQSSNLLSARTTGLCPGPTVGGLFRDPSGRSEALPLVASREGFVGKRQSAVHAGVSRGDAGRTKDQRHRGRAH